MTVAIITGASSGVGRDIAIVYAKSGINVVVAARREKELNELVSELTRNYGGRHLAVPVDLMEKNAVETIFDRTIASYGAFDIIVNNAGDAELKPVRDLAPEKLIRDAHLLFTVPLLMHHYAIVHFRKFIAEKKIKKGHIVDILSSAGQDYYGKNGVYGAAKHGMSALSIYNQMDEENIAFIRIYPSNIATSFVNESKAHPDVWNFIKNAPKLDPMDVARIVGKLTEEGDSIDLYVEQKADGPYVARFKKEKPLHVEEKTLEQFLINSP